MSTFTIMVEKIIEKQETIIGPIALEQAKKVPGLSVDWSKHEVKMNGNEGDIVEKLVEQYEHLFGKASIEACKEAVHSLLSQLPSNQVPNLLR